ncbi:hypothetical protein ACXN5S_16205 [Pseudoroseicyclus sp. H15]
MSTPGGEPPPGWRGRLRAAWVESPGAALAFGLAVLVALIFAVRMVVQTAHPPEPHDPQPWMTVRMVARLHGADPEALRAEAGLPPPAPRRRATLTEIARELDMPVDALIAEIEAAAARLAPPEEPAGGADK